MFWSLKFLVYALPLALFAGQVMAETDYSLDSKLRGLKEDVLQLNNELSRLEEELLFPSTQLSLFLSLDVGTNITLNDVDISLDNQHIVYHFYTDTEYSSLQRGSIQRIYTGNLISGEHELRVTITGFGPNGDEYLKRERYLFNKYADKKFVELRIIDSKDGSSHEFQFKEWD